MEKDMNLNKQNIKKSKNEEICDTLQSSIEQLEKQLDELTFTHDVKLSKYAKGSNQYLTAKKTFFREKKAILFAIGGLKTALTQLSETKEIEENDFVSLER